MIAIWMIYAIVVSTMIALGAVLFERGVRLANTSARWIWVVAIIASVAVPLVAMIPSSPSQSGNVQTSLTVADVGAVPVETGGFGLERLVEMLAAADTVLLAVWIAVSAMLFLVFLWTQFRLHRDARRWPVDVIANTTVRRAPRTGPAVVGWLPAYIVLPEWARELEYESQRLVLLHEREHYRAGDTSLLTAALLLVVFLPWNVALWWQLLRLRTAVELDCDQRVLANGVDARSYAAVLLDVAGRRGAPWTLSLGVADFPSLLARRIAMMTVDRPRTWGARAFLAVTLGAVLIVAACETPTPPPLMSETDTSLDYLVEPGDQPAHGWPVDEVRQVLREAELELAEFKSQHGDGPWTPEHENELERIRTKLSLALTMLEVFDSWDDSDQTRSDPGALQAIREDALKQKGLPTEAPYLAAAVDEQPERLSGPVPSYPAMLRRAGIEGEVLVEFLIDKSGQVVDGSVNVLRSTHGAFEAPARDMIQRSVFRPGHVNGAPVRVLAQQTVRFSVAAEGTDQPATASRDADDAAGNLIRITGTNPIRLSDDSDEQPLVLVDGRELAPGEFESVNPDAIERIEVLKGRVASNQYGERGANGVILITLKKQ